MKRSLTNIIRNSLIAGSFALGCIASDGCYKTNDRSPTKATSQASAVEDKEYIPTLEDFKKVLGDRYIPEKEKELKRFFNDLHPYERVAIYTAYDEGLSEFYSLLTQEQIKFFKEEFNPCDPRQINPKELESYKEIIPWNFKMENGIYSDQDKAFIALLHDVSHPMNMYFSKREVTYNN